jgi:uncharacterized protein
LTRPGPKYSAADLTALYEKEGKRIFARSLWHRMIALDNLIDEKYDASGLESVLRKYFGDTRLKDAVTDVLATSYELETREPWFFARHKAQWAPPSSRTRRRASRTSAGFAIATASRRSSSLASGSVRIPTTTQPVLSS